MLRVGTKPLNTADNNEQSQQRVASELDQRVNESGINVLTNEQRYSKTKIACCCIALATGAAGLCLAYMIYELRKMEPGFRNLAAAQIVMSLPFE